MGGNSNGTSGTDKASGDNKNLFSIKKLKNQARPKKLTLAKSNFFGTDFLFQG